MCRPHTLQHSSILGPAEGTFSKSLYSRAPRTHVNSVSETLQRPENDAKVRMKIHRTVATK
jgi:hypothetical protein